MLELTCTTVQKVHVKVNPKNRKNKPAALDGAISVDINSGMATAEVDDDGKGAWLIASDMPGDTEFFIRGDADLGEGVEAVQETIILHVLPENAKNLGVTADPAVDQDAGEEDDEA